MRIIYILVFILIFLLGFISASLIFGLVDSGYEVPLLSRIKIFGTSLNFSDLESPSDYVNELDIDVYDDKVIIWIEGATLTSYAPTGSMKPVLDEGANGIRVRVNSADDVKVGDIVSFKEEGYLIVHRVIEKGYDKEGVYFITKGDNNDFNDGKIRIDEIKYKTIGIIW